MTRYATGRPNRGRGWVGQLVGATILAVVASLLALVATQSPAAAEEPPSGYVPCGFGLVCNGSAPVTGDIAPIVVTGLDPWNRIVQKPGAAPLYSLEAEATAMVAGLHGVPNDRRVTLWARGEIRAMMFARLMQAVEKPSDQRTVQETAWIDNVTMLLRQRRVTMAQNAINEYNKWYADPCSYKPPFTYTTPPVLPQCALAGGGQLTTIAGTSWDHPPKLEQLQTYGAALLSDAEFGTAEAVAAVDDSTAALVFFAGAAAAATLSLIAAVTVGSVAALASAVGAAIGSGVALTATMLSASSLGGLAASLGTPVIAVGAVAGAVAMAVLGIVMIAIHSWQIDEALKLPTKLAQAKTDAQSDPIDLNNVAHDDCGDAPDGCGRLEIYSTLLAQTLPDYSAQRNAAEPAPTRRAFDPKFELFDEAGNSLGKVDSINPQGGDNLSMADGWFIVNDFSRAEYALESKYVDWNGTPSIVSIHGDRFATRAQAGADNQPAAVSAPSGCFNLLIAGAKRRACWTGNRAPVIAPTMTENPVEGAPVTFRANATDPDGDALTYQWQIEDPEGSISFCLDYRGTSTSCPWLSASTPEVTVTYPKDGLQHAKLVVTDSVGLSATQTFAFRVANAAPVVTLEPATPTTVEAGGTVTLRGTVTDQGRDSVNLTVDWGDGTTSTSSVNPCNVQAPFVCADIPTWGSPPLGTRTFEFTHTYSTDPQGASNTVQAKLTASDGRGTGSASTPVTITPGRFRVFLSFAEQFLIPGDRRTTTEGPNGPGHEPVELSGWVDLSGPFTLEVDWGGGDKIIIPSPCGPGCPIDDVKPDGLPYLVCDGACTGKFFHLTHFFPDGPSDPQVTVKVTDDDGRVITTGTRPHIINVAPTVRFEDGGGATGNALVGRPYSLRAALSDPGDDTFVSSIDWGTVPCRPSASRSTACGPTSTGHTPTSSRAGTTSPSASPMTTAAPVRSSGPSTWCSRSMWRPS